MESVILVVDTIIGAVFVLGIGGAVATVIRPHRARKRHDAQVWAQYDAWRQSLPLPIFGPWTEPRGTASAERPPTAGELRDL